MKYTSRAVMWSVIVLIMIVSAGCMADRTPVEIAEPSSVFTATSEPTSTLTPTPTETPLPTLTPTPPGGTTGRIVLSVDFFGDLNYDLYTLDVGYCLTLPDGCEKADLVRLTDRPGFVMFPEFSPDGDEITFVSEEELGGGYLFLMDADGEDIRQVTGELGRYPRWSGDGDWLVFYADRDSVSGDEHADIYIVDVNGEGERRLTADSGHNLMPDWSSTDDKIIFVSDRDGDFEIYRTAVGDEENTDVVQLTGNNITDLAPAWSPDGEQIAFVRFVSDDTGSIYVMDADGRGAVQLTDGVETDNYPAWSPDGGMIAFWSTRMNGGLFVVNADGTGLRPVLLIEGSLGALGFGGAVTWEP